ncbi:hypothetical protein [uncultured Brevundimonas sp.]|uniref:hypothetical protein n=1 Tax=uncultured Brevundimonas sp. TaxID=213418 RepID=UPI00260C4960|nr:hypothetical protein [uncultured Brevundimonas sp.]
MAWSRADDGWLVLSVAAVDADGYVAMVRDLDGRAIGVGRVYETSSLARPWLIVPANRVRAGCADEVFGLLASDLEEIKAALRPWKAVTQ